MAIDQCPSEERLSLYLEGLMPEIEATETETHISSCRKCSEDCDRLEKRPSRFRSMLRRATDADGRDFCRESDFQKVLASIERMGRRRKYEAAELLDAEGVAAQATMPSQGLGNLRVIGSYMLLQKIGEGGMGDVFAARHVKLRTIVAVKLLKPGLLLAPKTRERFQREIEAAGRLDHPSIVRARDAGEVAGIHFLAMDLVDGIDLSSLLRLHGPISIGPACEMIRMAAAGLREIHTAGMVHRDIKPGNLILSKTGQVQILDLGLALINRHFDADEQELTEPGQLMGTVDYISPEQADDTHRVDFRADIYGLGATLFALLTGQSPYGKAKRSVLQKLSMLATQAPPRLNERLENPPPKLTEVVGRMLQRDPNERYQDAADVAAELEPFSDRAELEKLVQQYASERGSLLEAELDSATISEQTVILSDEGETPLDLQARKLREGLEFRATAEHANPVTPRRTWALITVFLILACGLLGGLAFHASSKTAEQTGIRGPANQSTAASPSKSIAVDRSTDSPSLTPNEVTEEHDNVVDRALRTLRDSKDMASAEWTIFSDAADVDQRTAIIHAAKNVLPSELLMKKYLSEKDPSLRAGLILALSEFGSEISAPADHANSVTLGDFFAALREHLVNDSNPEVHASIEFLFRRTGHELELQELISVLQQRLHPSENGWYQPLSVSTMVVISGPRTVILGSPPDETGRLTKTDLNEDVRTVSIDHTFAIGSKEITRWQYAKLTTNYWEQKPGTDAEIPINAVTWDEAVRFCNLLSEAEGLTPEQYCYEEVEVDGRRIIQAKENFLELSGYRLPTEDEWELACRGGYSDIRFFGAKTDWIDQYVFGNQPQARPQYVGRLKPNSFGLFDMLGNVSEWTNDVYAIDSAVVGHILRGGSASSPNELLRSAGRYYYELSVESQKVGFRVARTILKSHVPSNAEDASDGLVLEVGPAFSGGNSERLDEQQSFTKLEQGETVCFGTWQVTDAPFRSFRIRNNGREAIHLSHLPDLQAPYIYVKTPSLQIHPGESTDFCIAAREISSIGTRTQLLKIPVSGVKEDDCPTLRLLTRFEGPCVEVFQVGWFGADARTISMGDVPLGSRLGLRLFLRNVGDEPIQTKVVTVDAPFVLTQNTEKPIVPHRLDESFHFVLRADDVGPVSGNLIVETIEPSPQRLTIQIRANVVQMKSYSAIGVFRDGTWLIDANYDAVPDETIQFGMKGDKPFTGDFNGDGICDLGVWKTVDESTVHVKLHFRGDVHPAGEFKTEFDIPATNVRTVIAMDRNADGIDELGYVTLFQNEHILAWMIDVEHTNVFEEYFLFGQPNDDVLVGDWTGDGVDDFAVSRDAGNRAPQRRICEFFWTGLSQVRERITLRPFDVPLGGDWDGDGDDDVGGWCPVPETKSSVWQFDVNGNGNNDRDLEGFGSDNDIPVVLRAGTNNNRSSP